MRKLLILASTSLMTLGLAGCNGGAAPIDSQTYLSSLEGPKITGVDGAMLQAAQGAESKANYKLAAQYYEQMLEKQPDNAPLLVALAEAYRRDGQLAKAITTYDAALAKDAKNIDAKEGKSLALIASGDFDTPVTLLDEVMQADAKRWKTLNALGILFTTRNMQPEAQQYFAEALKYHADSPSIYNNMGLSKALERNYDGSVATLAKASSLATPNSSERKRIDLNRALVLASAGNVEAAKAVAEQYLSGAELDNNMGLYAHLAQDDNMAKAYLNKALSDSKMYYAKAWENLDTINKDSSTPPAPASAKQENTPVKKKAPAEKKAAPVKKVAQKVPQKAEPKVSVKGVSEASLPAADASAMAALAPTAGSPAPSLDDLLAAAPPAPNSDVPAPRRRHLRLQQ